ncbi:MAG: YerC/YecD family TrpR-related protein [Acutalibacteraceae bacterium]|jgi:TrpR-related protein YerC/YecD
MPKKTQMNKEKFFKAVLALKNEVECAKFFDDICTIQEMEAIVQRFEVACLLDEGKSYVDINKQTGASTATICRVSRCLNYGDGGYKTVIDRIKGAEK